MNYGTLSGNNQKAVRLEREHDDKEYIYNLLLRIITACAETVIIVYGLPKMGAKKEKNNIVNLMAFPVYL